MKRHADVTFLAPSPRGFSGPRGWYLLFFRAPLAGPFASEREAEKNARALGFEI